MGFLTKWITVPESNETKEIEVVQLWEVRWTSLQVDADYSIANKRPEMEAFASEVEARSFAQSLRNAQELLKLGGSATRVTVEKAKGSAPAVLTRAA